MATVPVFTFSHSRSLLLGDVGNHDTFPATLWRGWAVSISASGGKGAFPARWRQAVTLSNREFLKLDQPWGRDTALPPSRHLRAVTRARALDHPERDVGLEPTSLPPFSTPALGVHDHRRPRLESAHPPEVGAASDTGAGQQLRHRESVLRFSELAQALRDWPLEFLADIAVLESDSAPLGSQTPASEAPLTQPLSDITPTAPRAKPLVTATCHGAVECPGLCAELGGRPPDPGHQFGWPQALDALPPASPEEWYVSRNTGKAPTINDLRKLTGFRRILQSMVEGNCGHDQH